MSTKKNLHFWAAKRYYYIILLFAFALFSFIPKHAIHLSITEMDFKVKEEKTEIQISHKVFIDDLEKALRKNYSESFKDAKPNLSTKTEHKEAQKYTYQYLKKAIEVKINSRKEEIKYIGWEFEGDVVWIYGVIEKTNQKNTATSEKETIFIKNMILIDLFDDQRNMLYLSKEISDTEKEKEFLNFTSQERTQTIIF
jgi:hypothetical protein